MIIQRILISIYRQLRWHLLVLFIALVTASDSHPQSINGLIVDQQSNPLQSCDVLLLNKADSSLIQGALSDKEGRFRLESINKGNYLLSIGHLGYQQQWIEIILEANEKKDAGTIRLSNIDQQLEQVVVTGYKPLFELKTDRLVVNVRNSVTSAGTNVLEVLQKSPGIIVNRQSGNISMSGKSGVQVMINGKMTYMPMDALINMLEGMSSSSVEKIELITIPPAKYDAGGNAGYINIILAQNPNEGFSANLSATMAAFWGNSPAFTADFNYRKKKFNLFGGYGISRLAQVQVWETYRRVNNSNGMFENKNRSVRDPYQYNNNLRIGFDQIISKKWTMGMMASGYINKWKMDANNVGQRIRNNTRDSIINIYNQERNEWKHGMGNVNIQFKPAASTEWRFNVDYLYYDNQNPTNYLIDYYSGSVVLLGEERLLSSKHTKLRILPVQLDYARKLSDRVTIEAGLKSVMSRFSNEVLVAKLLGGTWVPDDDFTANYSLKENITAAYLSSSWTINTKNAIQAGLRYEHTYSHLGDEKDPDIVNRKYGRLFPTIYWSHNFNDNHKTTLSYNRRINRPSFKDLAPFIIFMDPTSSLSGNAALQPGIADGVKLDYVFKQYLLSVGYTIEKDAISNFQSKVDTVTNKEYMLAQNLDYVKTFNVGITLPFTIRPWWSLYVNLNGNLEKARAIHLREPVEITQFYTFISGSNTFRLPAEFSFEISGFYVSKSLSGIAFIKPMGMLNMALQKKFKKNGMTLTAGVDDLFSSSRLRFVTDIPAQSFYSSGDLLYTRRMFKINFTYRLGNSILKERQQKKTASDEEQRRVR